MIEAIIVAIVIAALVGLLGPILNSVGIPIIAVLGAFFVRWGWVLGVLVGVLWFFGGGSLLGFGGKR